MGEENNNCILSHVRDDCGVHRKAKIIVNDRSHVLAQHDLLLPSGRRFRKVYSRAIHSFVLRSIGILHRKIPGHTRM